MSVKCPSTGWLINHHHVTAPEVTPTNRRKSRPGYDERLRLRRLQGGPALKRSGK